MVILMRTHTAWLIAALAVSAAPVCQADITLGAPGVAVGSQKATAVPFKNTVVLASGYKFVFAGIQAKGNTAGAPGSSGTNGNGGQFHVSATVTTSGKSKVGGLDFRDITDFNSSPLKTALNSP